MERKSLNKKIKPKKDGLYHKLFLETRPAPEPVRPGEPFRHRTALRLALLGLLAAGAIYLATASVNILVLGTDDVDGSQHTDTIMLVHWRPLPKRLALLSIPRDTLIRLPKRGPVKINEVYAYGSALGTHAYALAMTRAAIENLLGVKTNFLIHIRYSDFIQLVDALGGVAIVVAQPMHDTDVAGGITIHLEPGYQLLDGRQALDYVRFRHDREGDLGRIRRQQEFLHVCMNQMARFSRVQKTARAFYAFLHAAESNLRLPDLLFLALEMRSMVSLPWRQAILPGQPVFIEGKSYWQPDAEGIRQAVADLGQPAQIKTLPALSAPTAAVPPVPAPVVEPTVSQPAATAIPTAVAVKKNMPADNPSAGKSKPVDKNKPAAKKTAKPSVYPTVPVDPNLAIPLVPSGPSRSVSAAPGGRQPIVRVLNGCGVSGVCKDVAQRLKRQKILITDKEVTNAPAFNYSATIVKTNAKNLPWAKRIATILGLDERRIQIIPANAPYLTVTVVVGKDYQALTTK